MVCFFAGISVFIALRGCRDSAKVIRSRGLSTGGTKSRKSLLNWPGVEKFAGAGTHALRRVVDFWYSVRLRTMVLSFIMVLCLLVYRLTETQRTIRDQVHKPTSRPTMRWIFRCFEGIELLHAVALRMGFSGDCATEPKVSWPWHPHYGSGTLSSMDGEASSAHQLP